MVRKLLAPSSMQQKPLQKHTADQLLRLLAGERLAEEIYSKAFLELRDAEVLDNVALARLCHLKNVDYLEALTQEIPDPTGLGFAQTGPFSGDPRAAIVGIDPKFVRDYLRESESRSIALYREAAADGNFAADLPSGTLPGLLETASAAQKAILGQREGERPQLTETRSQGVG